MLDRTIKDQNGLSEHDRAIFEAWLIIHLGAGSRLFEKLFEHYSTPYEIYSAEEEELGAIGLTDKQIAAFSDKNLERAEYVVSFCERKGVEVINIFSDRYPSRLKAIHNPPYALFVKGDVSLLSHPLSVAVVGTRSMSEYGMRMAYKISYELSAAGACVVSGMALGIDGVAAVGALEGGGRTVAVLGCGLDCVYPPAHRTLMGAIAQNGALVSEYPPGTKPFGNNFPVRNRIISGLCQGSLIVEAGDGSGAMHTARDAIRQGRNLFALPGNVGARNTAGTNRLIRDGAFVVLSARDLLSEYKSLFAKAIDLDALADAEMRSELSLDALGRYGVCGVNINPTSSEMPDPAFVNEEAEENLEHKPEADAPRTRKKTHTPRPTATMESVSDVPVADIAPDPVEDEELQKILDAVEVGRSVTPDWISSIGLGGDEPLAALSLLEFMGYFVSGPGGSFVRKK